MTFAIGIFDLFAYAIPGALYLGFFSYAAARLHWIDLGAVGRTPVVLLVIVMVLASYLLGYLAYPVGALVERVVPRRWKNEPIGEFLRRVPAARGREFTKAPGPLLLGALLVQDKELAVEVTRLRAAGLMLRNSSSPLVLACVASVIELLAGGKWLMAAVFAVLFGTGAMAAIVQGRKLGRWAQSKTLELCFWLPDIDDRLRDATGGRPPVSS